MKLYRYYKTQKDWDILKNHVWFYTNVHDAAIYAVKGVVLVYEINQDVLKPVPDSLLQNLDMYEDPCFPNQSMLENYRDLGYNCYFLKRKGWEGSETSVCIFDKALVTTPEVVTQNGIFVVQGGMGGYLCRNVDNETFSDACFAPASLYERWKKNLGYIPKDDDLFYGYVKDEIFFNTTEGEFEKYVFNNCYHE